jgi:hypothetical protein
MENAQPDPSYHPSFRPPTNPDAPIWRYLDFPKLAWMVIEHRLFMPRSSVLTRMDPFEGSTPIARRNAFLKQVQEASTEQERQLILGIIERLGDVTRKWNRGYFVSCWHHKEYESDAMWKLYGASNNCVAIRSTVARLKACLPSHVRIGSVRYIDYATQDFPSHNLFENIVHKRRSFEQEAEVRAVAFQPGAVVDVPAEAHFEANCDDFGYFPVIDIAKLVECICVHPSADDWFLAMTMQFIRNSGHGLPVLRSEIAGIPVF